MPGDYALPNSRPREEPSIQLGLLEETLAELTSQRGPLPNASPPKPEGCVTLALARALILIYDAPWQRSDPTVRSEAANLVAVLAAADSDVLDCLIENARSYADAQHIDDAFPYSPNGFEVLAKVRPPNERIICFLDRVADCDYGIAKAAAAEALCAIGRVSETQTNGP
jgi:hypothetical protein